MNWDRVDDIEKLVEHEHEITAADAAERLALDVEEVIEAAEASHAILVNSTLRGGPGIMSYDDPADYVLEWTE